MKSHLKRVYNFCSNYAIACMIIIDVLFFIFVVGYISHVDIIEFDFGWVECMKANGFTSIYHMVDGNVVSNINYPPMYPFVLYLLKDFITSSHSHVTQVCLMAFPVIMFIVSQIYFYKCVSKNVALAWTFCLPFLFNVFIWGQRDAAFAFFLVLMFINIEKHNLYRTVFWFTMLCLLKPQGSLLLPVLFLYLIIENKKIKDKLLSLVMGCMIGLVAFLPFIIEERSLKTFLVPYLYAGGDMIRINMYAPNIWCLFCGASFPEELEFIPLVTIVLSMLLLFVVYGQTKNIVYSSFIYLFLQFMFAFHQTERYSLYSFTLLFFICFISVDKYKFVKYKICYYLQFIVCFIIQLVVYIKSTVPYIIFARLYPGKCLYDMPQAELNTFEKPFTEMLHSSDEIAAVLYVAFVASILLTTLMLYIMVFIFKDLGWVNNKQKIVKESCIENSER